MRVLILQYSSKCLILLNMLMLSYQKKSKFYHFWKAEIKIWVNRFLASSYHMLVYLLLNGNLSENKCFANFSRKHLQRYRRPCWVSWPYPIRAKFRLFLRVKQFEKKLCRHRRPIKRQEADKQPIMVHFTYRHSGQTGQSKDRRQTNNQSWCTLHTDTADTQPIIVHFTYSIAIADRRPIRRREADKQPIMMHFTYSHSGHTSNKKTG